MLTKIVVVLVGGHWSWFQVEQKQQETKNNQLATSNEFRFYPSSRIFLPPENIRG
jgi:hypothetical protein